MIDFDITLTKTGPYELSYTYSMDKSHPNSEVSLFVHNREKSRSASHPITGTSGEGKFTVSAVGYYDVRINSNGNTTQACARSKPVLIGPSVDLAVERAGNNIVVTYTINEDPAYPKMDGKWWIGAYKKGTFSNNSYVSWRECKEKKSGEKVMFDVSKDLKYSKLKEDAQSFDFRFFFYTSPYPYGYSGAATYDVLSGDSLTHIFLYKEDDKSCVSLTVYWERHDEAVGKSDYIGIYTPSQEGGAKVAKKYLTEGTRDHVGSGNICFDLTEWYAEYRKKNTAPPTFEICYFTYYPSYYLGIKSYKVDYMTINATMK